MACVDNISGKVAFYIQTNSRSEKGKIAFNFQTIVGTYGTVNVAVEGLLAPQVYDVVNINIAILEQAGGTCDRYRLEFNEPIILVQH